MGKTKRPKVAGAIRVVVGRKVKRLMDQKFYNSSNRPKALADHSGVSLSTVQRVIAAGEPSTKKEVTGASVDTVELLAGSFGIKPFELLREDDTSDAIRGDILQLASALMQRKFTPEQITRIAQAALSNGTDGITAPEALLLKHFRGSSANDRLELATAANASYNTKNPEARGGDVPFPPVAAGPRASTKR